MTTIKQWKSRLEEAAHFSQEDYENDKCHFMQAEIDELRQENAKLREDLKKQQALTDAGIRLCEIQQAKRLVLANVMEENARLRAVLTEYIAAADNCMLPEGADDIFRFAEAGKAARAALGEK